MQDSQATLQGSAKLDLRFGGMLVRKCVITPTDLEKALEEQRKSGGRLGEILLRLQVIDESTLTHSLGEHLNLGLADLADVSEIDRRVARQLPEAIAKRFCLLAIGEEGNKLAVAMADPLDVFAIDAVMLRVQRPIRPLIASRKEIYRAIDLIYHNADTEERQLRDLISLEVDGVEEEPEESASVIQEPSTVDGANEQAANDAPVTRFVELVLRQAVKNKASDIHIEPQAETVGVRMRIDGVLRDMVPPPKKMHAAVVARVKILAGMNIAERRLPQDGRLRIRTSGRDIDVRVSTIPTIYGEKVVMRILDARAVNHDLDRLDLEPEDLTRFKTLLARPHGIVIVTGPTGSGKSTTLYAALNYLKNPAINITTVEDPVEYRLAGINQIQVKSEIGLDFARCLRGILRQDPNIILIGEVRDQETVDIAITASLTGHLVLTTLHTNNAPSALSRLAHMGIDPYLLASTINLVVAQRLVRRICEHCKEPMQVNEQVLRRLGISPENTQGAVWHRGKGCNNCGHTGYSGRLPIFEFLVVDDEMCERIIGRQSEAEIRAASRRKGYGGLLESGVKAAIQGKTTCEEVLRVASTADK